MTNIYYIIVFAFYERGSKGEKVIFELWALINTKAVAQMAEQEAADSRVCGSNPAKERASISQSNMWQ